MPTQSNPAHAIVRVLFVNLGIGAVVAVLTILFREQILNHQLHALAVPPAQWERTHDVLAGQLWSRPGTIAVMTLVYAFVVRDLYRGKRRAYIRAHVVAAIGVVVYGYLVFSGQYPAWVTALFVAQALVALTLLVLLRRRPARAFFAREEKLNRAPQSAR